jgi:hypothetical protein
VKAGVFFGFFDNWRSQTLANKTFINPAVVRSAYHRRIVFSNAAWSAALLKTKSTRENVSSTLA